VKASCATPSRQRGSPDYAHRETLKLWTLALTKLPLVFYVRPRVVHSDGRKMTLQMPLGRRTKNLAGSMYLGALAVGADCVGGFMALRTIEKTGKRVSLVFQDLAAQFHQRAQSDVFFTCEDGERIRQS
jgi:hypothetical protein